MKHSCPIFSQFLTINEEVNLSLRQEFSKQMKNPYYFPSEVAETAAKILADELSYTVFNEIVEFKGNKKGILLIKGFPTTCLDDLPNTPTNNLTTNSKDFLSESILLGIAKLIGAEAYVNEGEYNDSIVHQLIPIEGKEQEAAGIGSLQPFDFHTENVHEISPPDFLSLFCLRGNKEAKTTYLSIEDIISNLPMKVISELSLEKFVFKTGPSYQKPFQFIGKVLIDNKGSYEIRYNSSSKRLSGIDTKSQETLEYLRNWLSSKSQIQEVCLEPGDLFIMKNNLNIHGRTSFNMGTDSSKRRWLQRVYLRKK